MIFILYFCTLICFINAELVFKVPSVIDKGLLSEAASNADIIKHHSEYTDKTQNKRFFKSGDLLAYVTPWNNHGYDVVKTFRGKFTHVSPVWFTVSRKGPGDYTVEGEHDVDLKWINNVRYGNDEGKPTKDGLIVPSILPRFKLKLTGDDYAAFSEPGEKETDTLSSLIHSICKTFKFDGIVLETDFPQYLVKLLFAISKHLKSSNMIFFLTIFPSIKRHEKMKPFDGSVIEKIDGIVDGYNLMTYDYSAEPGPVSPINWIEQEIKDMFSSLKNKRKVFMGMNFYGYDYVSKKQPNAITGQTFLEILKEYDPESQWLADVAEHAYVYERDGETHYIFYPTLLSLDRRIQLAEDLDVSIGVWEVGQGLDYFYDLL